MKFAVIGPTWPFRGGIAHYTTLLVKHMREAGHDVRFITYLKQYPKWLYPGNTAMDPSSESSVLKVDCDRVLIPWDPFTWFKALNMIKREQPDALILQWWTPFWSPFLFFLTRMLHRYHKPRIKVLVLFHHVIAPDGGILDWFLARRIWRHADAHIVMSEEDFALLRRALPQSKIIGSSHPTYAELSPRFVTQSEARRTLQIPETAQVLLFFGFVRRYKGLKYLIEAFARVAASENRYLLIAGEFWEDARPYYDLIDSLGITERVRVRAEYVSNDQVGAFFGACDLVVLPYLEASQSGIAQLALAFGRPIVSTSVGGMTEIIEHEGTGMIVPPGDVQSLTNAILRALEPSMLSRLSANVRKGLGITTWSSMIRLIENASTG